MKRSPSEYAKKIARGEMSAAEWSDVLGEDCSAAPNPRAGYQRRSHWRKSHEKDGMRVKGAMVKAARATRRSVTKYWVPGPSKRTGWKATDPASKRRAAIRRFLRRRGENWLSVFRHFQVIDNVTRSKAFKKAWKADADWMQSLREAPNPADFSKELGKVKGLELSARDFAVKFLTEKGVKQPSPVEVEAYLKSVRPLIDTAAEAAERISPEELERAWWEEEKRKRGGNPGYRRRGAPKESAHDIRTPQSEPEREESAPAPSGGRPPVELDENYVPVRAEDRAEGKWGDTSAYVAENPGLELLILGNPRGVKGIPAKLKRDYRTFHGKTAAARVKNVHILDGYEKPVLALGEIPRETMNSMMRYDVNFKSQRKGRWNHRPGDMGHKSHANPVAPNRWKKAWWVADEKGKLHIAVESRRPPFFKPTHGMMG